MGVSMGGVRKSGKKPKPSKGTRFACRAGGLCSTVAPNSFFIGYSRECHLNPTDIKPELRPGGAVRPFAFLAVPCTSAAEV